MTALNDDFVDILSALAEAEVDHVVVGAHALAVHGIPRATGDLDILVRPDRENAARLVEALLRFGAPLDAHGVTARDFESTSTVYQIGLPPRRIDILTGISGVSYSEAAASRVVVEVEGLAIPFLGREELLRNKRASGRDKDLVDARMLEQGST